MAWVQNSWGVRPTMVWSVCLLVSLNVSPSNSPARIITKCHTGVFSGHCNQMPRKKQRGERTCLESRAEKRPLPRQIALAAGHSSSKDAGAGGWAAPSSPQTGRPTIASDQEVEKGDRWHSLAFLLLFSPGSGPGDDVTHVYSGSPPLS